MYSFLLKIDMSYFRNAKILEKIGIGKRKDIYGRKLYGIREIAQRHKVIYLISNIFTLCL